MYQKINDNDNCSIVALSMLLSMYLYILFLYIKFIVNDPNVYNHLYIIHISNIFTFIYIAVSTMRLFRPIKLFDMLCGVLITYLFFYLFF